MGLRIGDGDDILMKESVGIGERKYMLFENSRRISFFQLYRDHIFTVQWPGRNMTEDLGQFLTNLTWVFIDISFKL